MHMFLRYWAMHACFGRLLSVDVWRTRFARQRRSVGWRLDWRRQRRSVMRQDVGSRSWSSGHLLVIASRVVGSVNNRTMHLALHWPVIEALLSIFKPRLHQIQSCSRIQVSRTSNLYPDTSGYMSPWRQFCRRYRIRVNGDKGYKWIHLLVSRLHVSGVNAALLFLIILSLSALSVSFLNAIYPEMLENVLIFLPIYSTPS